jgi:hypothetical protein
VLNSKAFAQFGIRAGINLANEIKSLRAQDISDGFKKENLTGYQIGLIYQAMPKSTGFGADLAVMLSQKGYVFTDSQSVADMVIQGYKEINYLEIPLNLRYHMKSGFFGIYGYGGLYGGYMLSGKSVDETQDSVEPLSSSDFMSRVDYGFNLGFGVEFFDKIQLGASWTNGLKEIEVEASNSNSNNSLNRVFSINLCYMF